MVFLIVAYQKEESSDFEYFFDDLGEDDNFDEDEEARSAHELEVDYDVSHPRKEVSIFLKNLQEIDAPETEKSHLDNGISVVFLELNGVKVTRLNQQRDEDMQGVNSEVEPSVEYAQRNCVGVTKYSITKHVEAREARKRSGVGFKGVVSKRGNKKKSVELHDTSSLVK